MRTRLAVGLGVGIVGFAMILWGVATLGYQASLIAQNDREQQARRRTAVLGVDEAAELFATSELKESISSVEPGSVLTILAEHGDVLHVDSGTDRRGWISRGRVCSQYELLRRRAKGFVPKHVMCVRFDGSGGVLYGGEISVVNDRIQLQAGDALWLDSSMEDREFRIAGRVITGRSETLILAVDAATIEQLHVWGPGYIPFEDERRTRIELESISLRPYRLGAIGLVGGLLIAGVATGFKRNRSKSTN